MIAKFNPTGTHIHKGFLKVRIDLYPEPTDKTYVIHYVDKPDRPYTEEEHKNEALRVLVPKHKELNPCLCHFITIDATADLTALINIVRGIFDQATLVQLDDSLSRFDTPKVSQIMRTKCGSGKVISKLSTRHLDRLNSRLSSLEVKV